MIGNFKSNRENYPRKCFWTQEKETKVERESAFEQLGPGVQMGTSNIPQKGNPAMD